MSSSFVAKTSSAIAVSVLVQLGATSAYAQRDPSWGEMPRRDTAEIERDRPTTESRKRREDAWLLSLEGVTNAPVDVGARITGETPFRLRGAAGFGIIPGAYLGLINDAVSGMGAYDDRTAGIVDGSFSGGHVWRAQVGFRPFPRAGFYVDGGYAHVVLSGNVYGSDVAPEVDELVVEGIDLGDAGYRVNTTLHMWLVEIGWQAQVARRMTLGAALGVMGTLSAWTEADPNFEQGRSELGRSLSANATREIDDALETYGYVPTLTLRIGYDFL
jgi:hypothetical protein